MNVIETEGLTRSFPNGIALDHLTIDVRPGEVLALLGPNGAGKTTTVRLLNGLLRPDEGIATVLGFDPTAEGDEVRRRTGVLTENAGLDERLTALENLVYTGRMRSMTVADATRRAGELLERFGMADRAGHQVQGFSTGQRKRVALARALLHEPEVLFLDEPTSGLDPVATREVVALIAGLAAEGRTVVLCTHFLGEAGRLAHRMAVLHRGRLRAWGRPEDLAAQLWTGLEVTLELGTGAAPAAEHLLGGIEGVLALRRINEEEIVLRITERSVTARVVAALVAHELPVLAATPRVPSLEDVYFEVVHRAEGHDGQA